MSAMGVISGAIQCTASGMSATEAGVTALPSISLVDVGTSVLCTMCLLVGLVGFLPAPHPGPLVALDTNQAVPELLEVEFTSEPELSLGAPAASAIVPDSAQAATPLEKPELPKPMPEVRRAEALEEPVPVKPFQTSVEPLVSTSAPVSSPTAAISTGPVNPQALPTAVVGVEASGSDGGASLGTVGGVETLVFGEGEGRQPAPRYPVRARNAGQQGTVWVQFKVTAEGHVVAPEVQRPSPWPLLNEEALRTVRDRYRFKPGRPRFYEISIRFELGR